MMLHVRYLKHYYGEAAQLSVETLEVHSHGHLLRPIGIPASTRGEGTFGKSFVVLPRERRL